MNYRQLLDILEDNEFSFKREGKGSHSIYEGRHSDKNWIVTLAYKKLGEDVKPGTLSSITGNQVSQKDFSVTKRLALNTKPPEWTGVFLWSVRSAGEQYGGLSCWWAFSKSSGVGGITMSQSLSYEVSRHKQGRRHPLQNGIRRPIRSCGLLDAEGAIRRTTSRKAFAEATHSKFDPSFPLHISIAKAGEAATAGVAEQLEIIRRERGPKLTVTVARRELRKWLRESAEGKAVEQAVGKLLQSPSC